MINYRHAITKVNNLEIECQINFPGWVGRLRSVCVGSVAESMWWVAGEIKNKANSAQFGLSWDLAESLAKNS